ncbi:GatB/YqeY domain-containing protein [Oecophyllibacter saccharovorans]|uniref:GatB/YqeY domain-containing protein n=1 Tax=Oecophyllibacter saccharovorans TaxID=2558360 RepID=A0A506URJ0_9PROT|nr:GatB/YqeY domain-containing protein [Oecophyllibacter saccharovorans]TPW34960.1 GatB/YqeY domain-containing protein [Oecophyllibacter saccharovorans]TPW35899.1 GatB/YqeY domain-containing protein [Oecophyllibacter saccharovorans]
MTTPLHTRIMDDLKAAMKAGDKEAVARLRGITAKLKDLDVEARARQAEVKEGDVHAALRSMIKSRTESAALYHKGGRPELAEKEEAEISTIKHYLPPEVDQATLEKAIGETIASTGAAGLKDMGRVMAALKERFGAALDAGKAGPLVKARLTQAN